MKAHVVEPRITEYLYQKAAAAGVPLSGTFELTPVCNMDCKMCYVRLSRQQQERIAPLKTAEQWLQLGEDAKRAGMLYLLLTGGEPFSHPQFRQIMEGLHRMGLLISLNSNGTMIDENTVAWLKNCPPLRVNISLYGTSDETYNRLCGNPKGFTQTSRAIDLLQQAGISVKLNCSLTPDNAPYLKDMIAFANERQLPIQVAGYMFPPARKDPAAVGQNFRLTPEEAAYYTAYSEYLLLGKEKFIERGCQSGFLTDPEENCADVGDVMRCRAGRCSFWITWQGSMTPCGMFPGGDSPNVFEEAFETAWNKVKAQVAKIRLPAPCANCSAKSVCRACGAMVLSESGSFDKVPRYRCQMTQAYPIQWERVKEELECPEEEKR